MLLGVYKLPKQFYFIATTHTLWSLVFLTVLISSAQSSEIHTDEAPLSSNEPLFTELTLNNVLSNTDVSCFKLNQSSSIINPIKLEYTTLSNQQGRLTLWSEHAVTHTLKLMLINQCQQTQQWLTIRTDNTAKISPIISQLAKIDKPTTAATTETIAITQPAPPAIPVEAYTSLQAQINDLQTSFNQLQNKSEALYASNLAQTNILTTLKIQLTHLQNENHLLRTLVITLGLTLIASGFFFADWLRRNATSPKTSKYDGVRNDSTALAHNAEPSPTLANDLHTTNPETQSPVQASKATQRLKSVPTHANDDDAAPHRTPQTTTNARQSTQSVMQDASHMFTHGRVSQAIELLQHHLTKHPKCSPWMWLYLLDLLSKEGKQQEFDIVAGECRKHFNLNVEQTTQPKQLGIESLPRIMKALQQAWGTPEVIALIDDLVYNSRLVPRMGFERSVFEDLMLLKEIASQTQDRPAVAPAHNNANHARPLDSNLRELQQLSEDIYILAPVEHTPFQYWTDFTFELDEQSALRKSA